MLSMLLPLASTGVASRSPIGKLMSQTPQHIFGATHPARNRCNSGVTMDNGKSHLRIADHCFCSDRSSIAIRWGIAIFVFACVAGSYPANSCADNREALLRKIKMATILIVADNGSQGSGVITYIRNKRYVLTAHHVVKGSKRIKLTSLGDRST